MKMVFDMPPTEPVDLELESKIAVIECWILDHDAPMGLAERVGRFIRGAVAAGVIDRDEFLAEFNSLTAPGDDTVTATITMNRSDLVPRGNGIRVGYSDDFPDQQFLIVPDGWKPLTRGPDPCPDEWDTDDD